MRDRPAGCSTCASTIISASRARVGERDGERGNFPLILQCSGRHHRFGARARPSELRGGARQPADDGGRRRRDASLCGAVCGNGRSPAADVDGLLVPIGWRRAPLTELLKPDGCRAPPRSSHRAAGARSQRSPSQNDTDVAGWRRVSCWSRRGERGAGRSARRSSVSQLAGIGARLARARKGSN